jgi:hypothetical protein
MTKRIQLIIDIIQWILIIALIGVCIFMYFKADESLVYDETIKKDDTYIRIYESQQIEALKNENLRLYDSIKNMKNIESAVEIKYKYVVKTDTIKVEKFKTINDSLYCYENSNDTVTTKIDVMAKDLKWINSETTINDNFTIINKEKENQNYLTVDHSNNVDVQDVTVWHRQNTDKKWYKNFHFGPQVGVGYGFFNKGVDIYVGVGVQYNIR